MFFLSPSGKYCVNISEAYNYEISLDRKISGSALVYWEVS